MMKCSLELFLLWALLYTVDLVIKTLMASIAVLRLTPDRENASPSVSQSYMTLYQRVTCSSLTVAPCPTLISPPDPSVRLTYNPATNIVTYNCETGYKIGTSNGHEQNTCHSTGSSQGTWSEFEPNVTCESKLKLSKFND